MRTRPFPLLSALVLAGCGSTVVRIDYDAGANTPDTPAPIIDVFVAQDAGNAPDRPYRFDIPPTPRDVPLRAGAVDLLLVVDNSNSMVERQLQLANALPALLAALADPSSSRPVRDVHIGVVSTDVGTGGHSIPSCANAEVGDDGVLNPIRSGPALRSHLPWTTLPLEARPLRCTNDPNQYPTFLTWDVGVGSQGELSQDIVCNALLSTGGCGLEQPLESAYRALVTHDAHQPSGVNGGFLREDAVLAILMLTDEEDGSVRDCTRAEADDPDGDCAMRGDARDVFNNTSGRWASPDLNLRFYRYVPGSAQDPTWSLNRYVDPSRPTRGFLGLKPGHPERVVFGALTGVPVEFSRQLSPMEWVGLLGSQPDGSDGYVGMTSGGVVSMRQNNPDGECPARMVPACRQEGVADPGGCGNSGRQQPYAWPARRVAEVVRRFDAGYGNGVVGSICASRYTDFIQRMTAAIQRRVAL